VEIEPETFEHRRNNDIYLLLDVHILLSLCPTSLSSLALRSLVVIIDSPFTTGRPNL